MCGSLQHLWSKSLVPHARHIGLRPYHLLFSLNCWRLAKSLIGKAYWPTRNMSGIWKCYQCYQSSDSFCNLGAIRICYRHCTFWTLPCTEERKVSLKCFLDILNQMESNQIFIFIFIHHNWYSTTRKRKRKRKHLYSRQKVQKQKDTRAA